jgi:hypothetical protein
MQIQIAQEHEVHTDDLWSKLANRPAQIIQRIDGCYYFHALT